MLGIQQPTLSQQLGVLREEQLVTTRREGKQIFYSIASTEAMAVMQVLYELYCTTAKERRDDDRLGYISRRGRRWRAAC